MEEEIISMTMEEDNNQYNPIEIKDNRIYNNYVMSIENEEDDDQDSTREKEASRRGEARLTDEKKRFTKGEKKRLVEKEEETNEKKKRVEEIEEKIIEDMKEKEEMKKKKLLN
ncbi:hypothetical protein, conserved [Entamoeba histolytica]